MSGRVNGAGDRIRDLQQARRGGPRPQQPSIGPADVLGMIDRVIASCGLDPRKSTDPQSWRRLSLGSAECRAGVIPWSPTERYLVVFAPLLRLPIKSRQLGKLYRLLLELNHESTQGARFSIRGDTLFVATARPIRGLDEVGVEEWHRKGHPIDPGERGIAQPHPHRNERPPPYHQGVRPGVHHEACTAAAGGDGEAEGGGGRLTFSRHPPSSGRSVQPKEPASQVVALRHPHPTDRNTGHARRSCSGFASDGLHLLQTLSNITQDNE